MGGVGSGRRPTPIERKELRAKGDGVTPGKRRPGTSLAVPPPPRPPRNRQVAFDHSDLPRMPASLGKRGRIEWFKVWDSGPWLHPEEDYRWVEMICRAYDDLDVFRRQIELDGLVVNGYNNQMVAHPLIAESRKCELTIMKCLSILGFSPTDRARLGLAEIKRQTGLADLQERTQKRDP